MKWRQIVQASDGIEGDIGETGGEVKFPLSAVFGSNSTIINKSGAFIRG